MKIELEALPFIPQPTFSVWVETRLHHLAALRSTTRQNYYIPRKNALDRRIHRHYGIRDWYYQIGIHAL